MHHSPKWMIVERFFHFIQRPKCNDDGGGGGGEEDDNADDLL